VIWAQGALAYTVDGTESSMMSAIGITDGRSAQAGESVRYMPVNGVIEGSSLSGAGDRWAAPDGALVPYVDVPINQFTRLVATMLP
jgi:hypothetical protein